MKHAYTAFLIIIFLILVLLFPTKAQGDAVVIPVLTEIPQEVQIIEIPSYVPKDREQYYLMIVEAFPDAPIMLKIARAESGFKPWEKNPNSSASGLFQILTGTWKLHGCEGDVFNAEDNIACARKIYDDSGTKPWNESKPFW